MKWDEMSIRQKSLDKAIEQCGLNLDNSDACLCRVMNAIGVTSSETSFVKQRIEFKLRTSALLNNMDNFISNTERMLGKFEKDDEEWRRRGRTLGFEF